MKYVKGFDSLRAFGTFFVVIGHFGVWFDTTLPRGKFFKEVVIPDGRLCVYFFFVLSGFLITNILLKAKEENITENRFYTLKNYIIRRSLRIYPLYYLLMAVLFLVNFPDVRQNIIYFATYTSNLLIYRTYVWNEFCVTWTLSIEEQFYLLWPIIVLFVKEKYLVWILAVAIVTGIVSTYFTVGIEGHIAPCLVYNCFDAFGIGSLYAYVKINSYKWAQFEKVVKWIACIGIVIYFYWKLSWFFNHPPVCMFMEKTIYSVIGLWLMILVINNKSAWLARHIWENRVLNFIGKMSYSVYLIHDVYINGCYLRVNKFLNRITGHHHTLNTILLERHFNYLLHVVTIFLISLTTYLLIEKPTLNLKRFYSYNKPVSM